jgi:hypothetical protein
LNTPIGGSGGAGRYSGGSGGGQSQNIDAAIGEMMATLRSQGREMKEMRSELKEIGTAVTEIKAKMPDLVTEKGCMATSAALASSVKEMQDKAREHTDTVAQDLKDRMDGRREITGIHRTLPEVWSEQAAADPTGPNPAMPRAFEDTKKKPRGFRYWITLSAALLALLTALVGGAFFFNRAIERQERMEDLIREMEKRLPAEAETKTTTARLQETTD